MRRLFLTTTAIVMLSCGTSLAQVASGSGSTVSGPTISGAATPAAMAPPSSTQAPSSTQTPSYPGMVSMPPVGAPGSALGAIHMNLGAPLAVGGMGAISTCESASTGGASNIPVDATDATATANPGFAASAAPTICQPPTPPPTAGLISAPVYSNSIVPLTNSEAGGNLGLSPSITVPIPTAPTSLCTNNATATPPAGSLFSSSSVATTVPSGC